MVTVNHDRSCAVAVIHSCVCFFIDLNPATLISYPTCMLRVATACMPSCFCASVHPPPFEFCCRSSCPSRRPFSVAPPSPLPFEFCCAPPIKVWVLSPPAADFFFREHAPLPPKGFPLSMSVFRGPDAFFFRVTTVVFSATPTLKTLYNNVAAFSCEC